jgi:hypothetical protein
MIKVAIQIACKAIYRHGPQIIVSRQEACDLRFSIVSTAYEPNMAVLNQSKVSY